MKKESKKAKSLMKAIKLTTIILLIVLISMIGFFGIYKQNKNQMSNIIKDYTYAMDINGARNVMKSSRFSVFMYSAAPRRQNRGA